MSLHFNARPLKNWERDYIINNYPEKSFREIAEVIGDVSGYYVRDRAIELGVHSPRKEKVLKIKDIDKQLNFKIGQTYRIKENSILPMKEDLFAESTRINGRRAFTGKLIDCTKDFLIFDKGEYKECVRKVDFLTGDYEVIK